LLQSKYVTELTEAHGADALVKFEELMEAAIDLDAVPEEYLIDAGYDPRLQVRSSPSFLSLCISACWASASLWPCCGYCTPVVAVA
jgi:hypothetical protein